MENKAHRIYEFEDFRLDVGERQLLRGGEPVTLNAKTFDMLLTLVENHGQLLTKDDLFARVWADQFVEESNLTVNMSAIRKALGEHAKKPRFIQTISGKGYRFTADVRDSQADNDLVIESDTVEHITIEREFEDFTNGRAKTASNGFGLIGAGRGGTRGLTVLLAVLLPLATFGAYLLFQGRAAESPPPPMSITRVTEGRVLGVSTISPDGKFIAYVENAAGGGRGLLFVQQTDTNSVIQLLEPDERNIHQTTFSPDGSLIYYVARDKRDPYGSLYSVPVLGGTPKRLRDNFASVFALSPDGRRLAFYRKDADKNILVIAGLEDGIEEELISTSHSGYLAWSPDGNLIAFNSVSGADGLAARYQIFGVDINSGVEKLLTPETFDETARMAWTSDGLNLVFVARRGGKSNQLYLMDHPSGEIRSITNDLETYGNNGLGLTADSGALVADVWERKSEIWNIAANGDAGDSARLVSGTTNGRFGIAALPDGFAYIARGANGQDIWSARADGGGARALTSDTFNQKDIAASPDGRYLVYASDQSGGSHIFRMNSDDGADVVQLTSGSTLDIKPDVSPDGKSVIYESSNGKQRTLWKVPIDGGESFQLTNYESRSPIFAPDGKTFACVLPSDTRLKTSSIAIVSASGGEPQKSFPVMPYRRDYYMRFTPDGDAVVFDIIENGVHNLWQQPIAGGSPRKLTNFQSGYIWNCAYTRDGKEMFLARGAEFVDVVLIKNFR